MKIGDKVKITITEGELNKILKDNKDLENEIMKCYNVKIGIIVDKFLPSKFISENYYCLDTNDNVVWKESELELID